MAIKIFMDVVTPSARGRDFYAEIGPFFMDGAVRRELPYLKDLPTKTWILAKDIDGRVLGFAGIVPHANGVSELCSLYVVPKYRCAGIAEALVEKRLAMVEGARVIRAVCAPTSASLYVDKGMKQVAKRGSYVVLERKAEKATA
ncbi:GNAT family N-acetyltransferase [Methylobacterium sp. BTF04]|uniref:GNAT family N-acetyltransferase n=1 Tax=Methylobacterium sp. BTF04 TaxID=2708300 RepID=UPI0013D3DB25|nr:GNAT family N-acetyltransferase [Methylobacterium sp. BTF04]NEU13503.1 GNAT family N-acetyltransferase [Methylobacterium sp. BTF04]